jgi:putative aminopeptidase FrvX
VDSAGDLIVALGPDRDSVLFVAHLDEIGFEITGIAHDGTVSLRPLGGFFRSLWEGQPALLHLGRPTSGAQRGEGGCLAVSSNGSIPGVFAPRKTATTKQPRELSAWFGVDSAQLTQLGVRVGMTVTGYKCATRLAGTRFTARSIDDRAGSTALLLALRSIDEAKLDHKVIFAWSTREETALAGAAAMGALFGRNIKRVHAVDTFVSSDSPLESKRFAYAPIGAGAVVRALDNSSVTPPEEVQRIVDIARRAGIPLQVGTTNGGNDGSELVRYGAVDVPLSWPLRYSHSPAEVIDLRDVDALARLVAAVAIEAR